jgi:hypothetical protein
VIFGKADGFTTLDMRDFNSSHGFMIQGAKERDFLGWSGAGAGDVNGTYIYVHVCICVCIYVSVYVYVYMYTCIYVLNPGQWQVQGTSTVRTVYSTQYVLSICPLLTVTLSVLTVTITLSVTYRYVLGDGRVDLILGSVSEETNGKRFAGTK